MWTSRLGNTRPALFWKNMTSSWNESSCATQDTTLSSPGKCHTIPLGRRRTFFLPLYEEMRKANGKWPYAIVATSDDIVVYVSYPASDGISLDYEQYAEQ